MIALALLTLASLQEPQLLPEPENWRFERIDFPLDFAPDLELEGFEELRFAPGMFEPQSDSYFTYALALRLEGGVTVDKVFLQDFLHQYYEGLCASVAEGRGLELDLSQVAVDVAHGAHGFVAEIDMYDAFFTGEPLRLALEMAVRGDGDTTELIGLASPQPKQADVWRELRSIGEQWRSAREPGVFLNHLYFIPDEATYRAIAEEPFLREGFAVWEERTTERTDVTYTGRYFYGEHTYFEFLEPDAASGFAAGGTGIAFGFESEGATETVAASLKEAEIPNFSGARTRGIDGKQVPWFKIMGVESAFARSKLSLFSLEYDRAFLPNWHGGLAPQTNGIARADVLTRYASHLAGGTERGAQLLEDVTAVHVALPVAEHERVLSMCRTFGYSVEQRGDVAVCGGPGYTLHVSHSDAPGRVTAFVCRLRRPVESRTVALGQVTLELEGTSATFQLP